MTLSVGLLVFLSVRAVGDSVRLQTGAASCPERVWEVNLRGGYENDIRVLDHLVLWLAEHSEFRIYVITFGKSYEMPGPRFRLGVMVQNYLTKIRNVAESRVVLLHATDGASRAEIWVGVEPPQLEYVDGPKIGERRPPYKYDEYSAFLSPELSWVAEEDVEARLGPVAFLLQRSPELGVTIVGHRGTFWRETRQRTGLEIAMVERLHLIERFGIAPERITVKAGSARRDAAVQLYIIVRKPTANNRLHRTAHPRVFCLSKRRRAAGEAERYAARGNLNTAR